MFFFNQNQEGDEHMKVRVHYLRYAGLALLLALITAIVLPVFRGIPALYTLPDDRYIYGVLGVIGLFVLWTTIQMIRQGVYELSQDGTGSVLLVGLGQILLFAVTLWQELKPDTSHNLFMAVTMPIFFVSMSIVYLTLNWAQKKEIDGMFPENIQKRTRSIVATVAIMAATAFAIFFYRSNIEVAALVAGALLIVVDPRWAMIRVSSLRKHEVRLLAAQGIDVINDRSLDRLPLLSNVIIEKEGVLTESSFKVYSVSSLTAELSEYDVLTIVASLEANLPDEFSHSVIEYAQEHGVYPVDVEEQTVMPSIGVKGEVYGVEYSLVMASYAHEQQYRVNANRLEAALSLGNSVRLLVLDDTVIGAVNYGETFRRDLGDLDRYFQTYDMNVRVATTDTMGSVRPIRGIMKSVVTVTADLTAEQQYAQQMMWTNEVPTLFLTNGALPAKVNPEVVVKAGDNQRGADIMVAEMTQMPAVHKSGQRLRAINRWTVVRWAIWSIILVAALFMAELVVTDWLLAPTLAIVIRVVMTMILSMFDSKNK